MKYLTSIIIFILFTGCQTVPSRNVLLKEAECTFFGNSLSDSFKKLVLFPNGKFIEYFGSVLSPDPVNISDRGTWIIDKNHIILTRTLIRKDIVVGNMLVSGIMFGGLKRIEKLEEAIRDFLSNNTSLFFNQEEIKNIYKIYLSKDYYIYGIEFNDFNDVKINKIKREQLSNLLKLIVAAKNDPQQFTFPMILVPYEGNKYLINLETYENKHPDAPLSILTFRSFKKFNARNICKNSEKDPTYIEICEQCSK